MDKFGALQNIDQALRRYVLENEMPAAKSAYA